MAEAAGTTGWSNLPVDLQHQFFIHAEEESKKCKQRLLAQAEKLKALRKDLHFEDIPEDDEWRKWKIASVDGSFSPATSERLGARYGVCCAGYMVFRDGDLVNEYYRSGELMQEQVGDPDLTATILSLLSTRLERELALQCIEKEKADLVLVDGAFFGYRAKLSQVRSTKIDVDEYKTVGRLADFVTDCSLDVMNSGKAVAVVKRVRTNALDGWLISKNKDAQQCIQRNDRAILASIMPPETYFAYEWLLGSPTAFNFYTTLRTAYEKMGGSKDLAYAEQRAKEIVENDVLRSLNTQKVNPRYTAEDIYKTARYYMRCSNAAPPFCFETLQNIDVKPILAYFAASYNPATGLPFPMDLIDQNVSLPTEFTREFVEEVEALLIHDPEIEKFDLSNYFQSINPQKEE